ncbi:MAG: hypothetical protein KH704_01605 [Clostridiales bacterium]|nr:hypothetical protein [Clostridiales bacterium]
MIRQYRPLGLFLAREGRRWTAVDNTTGQAWTETFAHRRHALLWLSGQVEAQLCQ